MQGTLDEFKGRDEAHWPRAKGHHGGHGHDDGVGQASRGPPRAQPGHPGRPEPGSEGNMERGCQGPVNPCRRRLHDAEACLQAGEPPLVRRRKNK